MHTRPAFAGFDSAAVSPFQASPTIPRYHAVKATDAIKPIVDINYHENEAGIWKIKDTYDKMTKDCRWVASSASSMGMGKGVMFFGGTERGEKAPFRSF